MRVRNKIIKRTITRIRRSKDILVGGFVIAVVVIAGFVIERSAMNVDYTTLLSVIAEGESRGNYNAYFGNANNSSVRFTEMPIEDVLEWQRSYLEQGNPSNAVGRYQFIEPTLWGLVGEMNIDGRQIFDEELQDKLAIRLLERRGVHEYLHGQITREELAHNLSKEWAALPRVMGGNPSESYYADDGLNEVQVSVDQVFAAISSLREYKKG